MPSVRHSIRLAAVVAALSAATALAVPTAGAAGRPSVCKLLSARQLAAVHVGTACTHSSPLPFKQGGVTVATVTSASWGRTGHVMASIYAVNSAYVTLARSKFDVGGTSVGVGDWSRFKGFSNGRTIAEMVFAVGNHIVDLEIEMPPNRPLESRQQVVKLASAIAGKL